MRDLLAYVGFTDEDAAALHAVGPSVTPSFARIVDEFYDAIMATPAALAVFRGGQAQIDRQRARLREWLSSFFEGTYDDAYFEHRLNIGRVHVQHALPQRFMFSAMSIVRRGLHRAVGDHVADAALARRADLAIDKLCDVELAVMLETYREKDVERQRQRERLATLGQLAASIGHELRNPLAVMATSLHLVRARLTDAAVLRHLDKIERQSALMNRIVVDLLAFVRDRTPTREPVDLETLLDEIKEGLPRQEHVVLRTSVAGLPRVSVDRLQIRQVLTNLVANAIQAVPPGKTAEVHLLARLEDETLVVEVLDEGPGFAPDMLARAFEPLVTTRDTGVGLGLALSKQIVEAHGGVISAENRPEGGARVELRVPGVLETASP